MNVKQEIIDYAKEADKPILLSLFARFHMESQWNFVAGCTHDRYGVLSYQTHRIWFPTHEGQILYEHMLKPKSAVEIETISKSQDIKFVIPIQELNSKATPGQLYVLPGSNGKEVGTSEIGTVFVSKHHQPWDGCEERSRINAILVVHRWNNFMKVMEALKQLDTMCREDSRFMVTSDWRVHDLVEQTITECEEVK
jgi:hypothetical protein